MKEGGVGIFGFADLTNAWFGFSVFALEENCGFSVLGVFLGLRVFSNLVSRFRFSSIMPAAMMAVFLWSSAFYGFSGFNYQGSYIP